MKYYTNKFILSSTCYASSLDDDDDDDDEEDDDEDDKDFFAELLLPPDFVQDLERDRFLTRIPMSKIVVKVRGVLRLLLLCSPRSIFVLLCQHFFSVAFEKKKKKKKTRLRLA
jgi:hypothetical protein